MTEKDAYKLISDQLYKDGEVKNMHDNLKLEKAKEKSIKMLMDVLEELDYDFNVSGNPFRPRPAELSISIKADSLSDSITRAIYLIEKIEL